MANSDDEAAGTQDLSDKVERFCDAVRAKKNWYFKILDDERDLGTKWANEAGFLLPNEARDSENLAIRGAIEELKCEANRIRAFDHRLSSHDRSSSSARAVDLAEIDTDVLIALRYLRGAPYAIRKVELRQDVGVYASDGAIPPSLHRELVTELDALANAEPKDFHPGTLGKVQDLIHPSLYPFIAGITHSLKPPALNDGKFKSTKVEIVGYYTDQTIDFESVYSWIPSVFHISDDGLDVQIKSYINGLGPREQHETLYRLIEKAFLLVLPHIERTLAVKFKPSMTPSVRRWEARSRLRITCTREKWNEILEKQVIEKAQEEKDIQQRREEEQAIFERDWADKTPFQTVDNLTAGSSLRGRDLKVIVKAANYELKPGEQYEGTWHLEGMPHERIVASAIYYYETDADIQDRGLSLRYMRCLTTDFPSAEENHSDEFHIYFNDRDEDENIGEDREEDYPSDWETEIDENGETRRMSTWGMNKYINIGTVPTTNFAATRTSNNDIANAGNGNQEQPTTGRIISFPNWVQHKVESISNGSDCKVAKRKILCFFLVDDQYSGDQEDDSKPHSDDVRHHSFSYTGLVKGSVLTTLDVPLQKLDAMLYSLLPAACRQLTGKILPTELVAHLIDLGELGLSREMAEAHRRLLMKDRKVKPNDDDGGDDYSLCEH